MVDCVPGPAMVPILAPGGIDFGIGPSGGWNDVANSPIAVFGCEKGATWQMMKSGSPSAFASEKVGVTPLPREKIGLGIHDLLD